MSGQPSAGSLLAIYLAAAGSAQPRAVDSVQAVPGRGLADDRYFAGVGYWSYDPGLCSQITLIESEALCAVAAECGVQLDAGAARRNLVTTGVALNDLVGRVFRVGEVQLVGDRLCHPCRHLDELTGAPAKAALRGRGGLRASIRTPGMLHPGDPVVVLD